MTGNPDVTEDDNKPRLRPDDSIWEPPQSDIVEGLLILFLEGFEKEYNDNRESLPTHLVELFENYIAHKEDGYGGA